MLKILLSGPLVLFDYHFPFFPSMPMGLMLICSRRLKQMTFSDAFLAGALRVKTDIKFTVRLLKGSRANTMKQNYSLHWIHRKKKLRYIIS